MGIDYHENPHLKSFRLKIPSALSFYSTVSNYNITNQNKLNFLVNGYG